MKTLKNLNKLTKKIIGFTLLLASSPIPHPQALAADRPAYPETQQQALQSLESQRLTRADIESAFNVNVPEPTDTISDLQYFATTKVRPPVTNEGIPNMRGTLEGDDINSIIQNAYSPAELAANALHDRERYPMGQRILFLQDEAKNIIIASGTRPTDILLRITLNRYVDTLSHVLPSMGRNTEMVAQQLSNFGRENFERAAAFGNNRVGIESRLAIPQGRDSEVAHFLRKVSTAEFGRIYSDLMFRYSTGLSSDSAKAIMLMRLTGYLGWDFNNDLRRRERPLAQTLADIYKIQHGRTYIQILNTIKMGYEPAQSDVAALRSDIFDLLGKLPARLKEAGIYSGT